MERGSAWLFVACLAGAVPVRAEAAGLRLDWVRAEGAGECINGPALEARVAARLGRDPFHPPHALAIEGVVTREGEAFVATLSLRSVDGASLGARVLRSERSCVELSEAVELALALVIDELVPFEEPSVEAPPVEAQAEPEPPPPREAPREEPARPSGIEGWTALALPVAFGVLPEPAMGIGLAGGVRFAPWHVELALYAFPDVGIRDNDARFSFSWLAGSAAFGIGAPLVEGLELLGSLGVEVGVISVALADATALDAGPAPTVAPFASVVLRLRIIDLLAVELGGRASVPLIPRAYLARGSERVIHEQAPVGGMVWAALVLAFGGNP